MSDLEFRIMERFVNEGVNKYGQGMDEEECHAEGWRAVLEARESYRRVAGCCDFASFAEHCLEMRLGEMRQARNKWIALHSPCSLDAPYYNSDETIGAHLPNKIGDCSNAVALWDYVTRLGEKKYRVLRLMNWGMSDREIITECQMLPQEYFGILEELQGDFTEWLNI